MIAETILNRSDTHSNGLKSTVPSAIVKKYGLKKGSKLEWDTAIVVEGKIIENSGGKPNKKPENIIMVRVHQEDKKQ